MRVETGVSVSKFHRRQVLSPEPVARSFPVGEKDAQRIGEACPSEGEEGLARRREMGKEQLK